MPFLLLIFYRYFFVINLFSFLNLNTPNQIMLTHSNQIKLYIKHSQAFQSLERKKRSGYLKKKNIYQTWQSHSFNKFFYFV